MSCACQISKLTRFLSKGCHVTAPMTRAAVPLLLRHAVLMQSRKRVILSEKPTNRTASAPFCQKRSLKARQSPFYVKPFTLQKFRQPTGRIFFLQRQLRMAENISCRLFHFSYDFFSHLLKLHPVFRICLLLISAVTLYHPAGPCLHFCFSTASMLTVSMI